MITEAPAATAHQQRARAIGVLREVEFAIPDDLRANLTVTSDCAVQVQLDSEDPGVARTLAIALGFTRDVDKCESVQYVHHNYRGSIDGFAVKIVVLSPKVATS